MCALADLMSEILALAVAMSIGRFAYTPILPAVQERFGPTDDAAAALALSKYLGYLLGPHASIITGGQHPAHYTVIRGATLSGCPPGYSLLPEGRRLRWLAHRASPCRRRGCNRREHKAAG